MLATNLLAEWDAFLTARDSLSRPTPTSESSDQTEADLRKQSDGSTIDNDVINSLTSPDDNNVNSHHKPTVEPEIVVRKTAHSDESTNRTEAATTS